MRTLKKWGTGIGITICIAYILMYLGAVELVVELFILLFVFLFILSIFFLFICSKFERRELVKFIAKLFVSGLIIFSFIFSFLFITVGFFPLLGSKFAKDMTKEKILSLKLGMSKDEVINIMGKPIKIIKIEDKNEYGFVYATPGIYGVGFEFDMWLINDKLDEIHIERNDYGVYYCNNRRKGCSEIFMPEALEELISYSSKRNRGWIPFIIIIIVLYAKLKYCRTEPSLPLSQNHSTNPGENPPSSSST